MVLITGATGAFGSAVIDFLIRKGFDKKQISALVRNPDKARDLLKKGIRILKGDYDNYASLVNAFRGIEKLLFIPGRDLDSRMLQNENIVRAAREAGIAHVIYASFERRNEARSSPLWPIAEAHLLTERLLKEDGLAYTILKNNLYMDFIPDFIGRDVLKSGKIYLPAGNGKVSTALRADMAAAAAEVLLSPGHGNKVYDITNIEAYSYNDIAGYLSGITGRTIRYISPEPEGFAETLKEAGVPARVAAITIGFAQAQAQGELDLVSHDLADLIKRRPVSMEQYLRYFYQP